jgi:hypothetical protein
MKVEKSGPVHTPSVRNKKRAGTDGSGFSEALSQGQESQETGQSHPVSNTPSVGGVDALLALQEVDDATARRAKMRARADKMLDELEQLRTYLLLGMIPRHKLIELARMVEEKRESVEDPQLSDLLEEVDLRVRVELAKYDRDNTPAG